MSTSKAAVESVAGGIGSLIALFTTYPLKTVRALHSSPLHAQHVPILLFPGSTADDDALCRPQLKTICLIFQ